MLQKLQQLSLYNRKRLFFCALPILVWTTATTIGVVFGIIGNGKAASVSKIQGLNATLPGAASSKDSSWNKLQFYEKMDKDSAAYYSEQKSDPYLNLVRLKTANDSSNKDSSLLLSDLGKRQPDVFQNDVDPNESKVYEKLHALQKLMDQQQPVATTKEGLPGSGMKFKEEEHPNTMELLQNQMQRLETPVSEPIDPELHQLNGMLEKILDIQHPERINEQLQQQSALHKKEVFPVTIQSNELPITHLGNAPDISTSVDSDLAAPTVQKTNGFYSLETSTSIQTPEQNDIPATIDEDQTFVTGSTVKMHTDIDLFVKGLLVPKGQLIYGIASLDGERLNVEITNICFQKKILPVALTVYDLDGIKGIYTPGALSRDVIKQSSDQAVQSLNLTSMDPSIGAQAASAGIQAAKSLIGKKAKLIKVTVRAGYHVLLKDNNQKSN